MKKEVWIFGDSYSDPSFKHNDTISWPNEIANKYNITKETVKSITSKRSREHAWQLYESKCAETISKESTSEANAGGKSLLLIEDDNIVQSI